MDQLEIFFTHDEIESAKKYKYNGKDDSICVKYFLRRYWDFLINYIPLNVAPNLITLIGFLFEVFSFFVSFIVSNKATQPLPCWACIMNGITLHIYQTLDNLDGRQARRTGSSSPLGQFFDHGCDAITGVFEMMKVVMSFEMGNTTGSYIFIMLMAIGFFLTSWEEYIQHAFYLGYINGPDEGLLFLSIVHILAGVIPGFNKLGTHVIVQILFVLSALSTILPIFYNVIKSNYDDFENLKKAGISLIPACISISLSITSLFSDQCPVTISFFIIASSLVLQYQSQMIIVAFLTQRQPKKLFDYTIGAIWAFMVVPILIPSLNEGDFYWGFVTLLIISIMIYFDLGVVFSFSKGLDIPILTLKPKESSQDGALSIQPEDLIMEEEEDKNDATFENEGMFHNTNEEVP